VFLFLPRLFSSASIARHTTGSPLHISLHFVRFLHSYASFALILFSCQLDLFRGSVDMFLRLDFDTFAISLDYTDLSLDFAGTLPLFMSILTVQTKD
jgi:hypothetical protein